jgi:nucleoid-associated protein YgaU
MTYAAPADIAPAPQAAQPVWAEPAPVPAVTETPFATATGGGSYTVKKGDTLFSIAKQSYGSGKDWQRIVAANPGLSPGTLKAGKTIVIP